MNLFFIVLTLAVLGVIFAVAGGRIAVGFDSPSTSIPARALPEGQVSPGDLDTLRFVPALRGYRMDQVDAALDRLREELRRRDEELAVLRGTTDATDAPGGADAELADDRTGQSVVDPGMPTS